MWVQKVGGGVFFIYGENSQAQKKLVSKKLAVFSIFLGPTFARGKFPQYTKWYFLDGVRKKVEFCRKNNVGLWHILSLIVAFGMKNIFLCVQNDKTFNQSTISKCFEMI